jgi:hypothetical protein
MPTLYLRRRCQRATRRRRLRFWLQAFSDEELAEIVWFVFGHRPDRAHICSERERLLGRVGVAG